MARTRRTRVDDPGNRQVESTAGKAASTPSRPAPAAPGSLEHAGERPPRRARRVEGLRSPAGRGKGSVASREGVARLRGSYEDSVARGGKRPPRVKKARRERGGSRPAHRPVNPGSLPVPSRLLGVHDAAAYLGLSHWTVREMAWKGEVPEVRLGRRLLFDIKDLDNLIERNKQNRRQV